MTENSALVVFSGGQDSTTCLFWAKKNFEKVFAICFDYGQRHITEIQAAKNIAKMANIDLRTMQIPFINQLTHNALTDIHIKMDEKKTANSLPNTFVQGRNLFFLSIAAVYARESGAKNIVTGVSQTDFSGYPDCRDTFIRSLNATLNLALEEQFIIHTPLMWLNKAQTWQLADELGVFDIVKNFSLTCYNGITGDGCGNCPACKLRSAGLKIYRESKNEL
ncbi:MAG: 7-cyano-7-deazaguanine synthase QueC [Prevotellaceae bacterium]|jgi:7-cyano-7-deazaguanine synthase|nr:7-cyano-7-deazaguanine synthase QueC [Prevotellaceae bacterium]